MILAAALALSPTLAAAPPLPADLALNRPATASSVENDDHAASRVNDGRPDTGWTADDEPEGAADWWQVDLGGAFDLSACEVVWPFDGMNYRYKAEGSADGEHWQLLADRSDTRSRLRRQRLAFGDARGLRYLRITVVGFDDGCCAGINDVKVFGTKSSPSSSTPRETH